MQSQSEKQRTVETQLNGFQFHDNDENKYGVRSTFFSLQKSACTVLNTWRLWSPFWLVDNKDLGLIFEDSCKLLDFSVAFKN